MLAVAVHDNDRIAARAFQARAQGQLLPEIAAQANAMQRRERFRFFRQDLPGLIWRAVINDDQLEGKPGPGEGGRYANEERTQVRRLLVERDYDRDERRLGVVHNLP